MKFEQYLYLIEIADSGSFSQAARNLFVSQPNLSYAVKQTELKLGTPIFKRTGSGVVPTKEGADLIEQLRFLKKEYSMIDEQINYRNIVSRITFRVATLNMVSTQQAFRQMVEKYCNSPISFTMNNYTTLNGVLNHIHEVDVGVIGGVAPFVQIMRQMVTQRGAEYHEITNYPVCVLIGPKNPLYEKEHEIKLEEILPYTTIQLTDNTDNPLQSIPHALGIANLTKGNVRVNETAFFYKMIRETPLVGVDGMPGSFNDINHLTDLKILRIADCDLTWQLAWIKSRRVPLGDLSAEFVELCNRFK